MWILGLKGLTMSDFSALFTGVSIRFCSFEGANENVWHVLVSLYAGLLQVL